MMFDDYDVCEMIMMFDDCDDNSVDIHIITFKAGESLTPSPIS